MNSFASARAPSTILPPRGLLIALLCQLPLLFGQEFPLRTGLLGPATGLVLILFGAVLNIWADRLFKRAAVGVRPFSDTPRLVTDGPFALTRSPMYVGLVAVCAGFALVTGVYANLWVAAAYAIWLHFAYVVPEERFLCERFGPAFAAYAQRVPRWLKR
jgi:protein-S-isoprenylcysteine O-methyltransferase Ste14